MISLRIRGFLLLAILGAEARADGPDHAIASGFERFHADPKSDPVRGGLLLLGELNCVSCHRVEGKAAALVSRKEAPILDAVASRAKVDWMRSFVLDPQAAKPGTTMPNVLASLPEAGRREMAEALVQFLATTGKTLDKPIDRGRVAAGSTLFHEIGCAACHGPRDGSPVPAGSIPLGDPSAKYTSDSLRRFLALPEEVRPSGRMPSLNLDGNAAWELANFLRKDAGGTLKPSLSFRAYEGSWNKLPDFEALTHVKTGVASGFDLSQASRPNDSAMRFEGFVRIEKDEDVTFHVTSDDGSRLWIDGRLIVDNDGTHPPQTNAGRVKLDPGFHKIVVGYFNGGGGNELSVEIEARNLTRQAIEPYLSLTDAPPKPEPGTAAEGFVPNPAKIELGERLFSKVGCASCHSLRREGKPVEPTLSAAKLIDLNTDRGCLGPDGRGGSPKYALNGNQKSAIVAAIRFLATGPEQPANRDAIARTLTTLNCYACHERGGVGGVEDSRKGAFGTNYQDLGDEGRFPPHLNGVGAKINPAYLGQILDGGVKDRPYMKTRMPRFGTRNLDNLAIRLAEVDAIEPLPGVKLSTSAKKVKSIGRHLVGTQAFGCVQCHTFRGEASAGIPAIDMAVMTRRLNHDWFARYVTDPQAYRPGTRMPSAWPKEASQLKDVLGGSSREQVEAVWQYLSDGEGANPPYGIGRSPIPLVADKEAILYRGFILGAGPRGIGVGYPGGVNLAYDAASGRVAMIWKGAFFDASRHWNGRGEGYQPPLGDDILHFAEGPTIAKLVDEKAEWPKAEGDPDSYRFRGYRLNPDQKPTFLSRVGPVEVEDFSDGVPAGAESTMRRVIRLFAPGEAKGYWIRAAVGNRIQARGDGWYQVDEDLTIRIEGAGKPLLRPSGGKSELLVPVEFAAGKATITQTYRW